VVYGRGDGGGGISEWGEISVNNRELKVEHGWVSLSWVGSSRLELY